MKPNTVSHTCIYPITTQLGKCAHVIYLCLPSPAMFHRVIQLSLPSLGVLVAIYIAYQVDLVTFLWVDNKLMLH